MSVNPEHIRYLSQKALIHRHGYQVATRCGAILAVAILLVQAQPFGFISAGIIGVAAFLLMAWPELKSLKAVEAEYLEYTTSASEEEGQANA